MKNNISRKLIVFISIFVVVIIAAGFISRSKLVVPVANPVNGCALAVTEFNSWFNSGSVKLNGVVKPFASDDFQNPADPSVTDCNFFKWSEQTFLWLTSPSRLEDTLNVDIAERIFESPAFYDVSPPDANGNRKFIPHEQGKIRLLGIRDAQVGANKLPVVFEKKTGRMLEVEKAPVSAKGLPLITNNAGIQTEIASVTLDNNMKPVFKDNSGKVIQNPKPVNPRSKYSKSIVYKFMAGNKYIYLDSNGNNIEVEAGQADGGDVLMSQNNSLVYYSISVNQVYAIYLTWLRNEGLDASSNYGAFPHDATYGGLINYAATHGQTIRYPEAATIEIKCSWVEAASLPDASKYIRMKATIPVYNKSATHWTPIGQKIVEMALVGMHIVGKVHWMHDMVWATFEHIGNTPNAAYFYNNTGNSSIHKVNTPASASLFEIVPQNTSGPWTFCADGSNGPFNVPRMHMEGNNIVANAGNTIGIDNIIRWKPWGSGSAHINTELKSLNNSVKAMLMNGDVRKNYFQVGTTWKEEINGNKQEKGSTKLANSTMETFMQGTNNSITNGTTCFSCHTPNGNDRKAYSHIYYSLKPLFQ